MRRAVCTAHRMPHAAHRTPRAAHRTPWQACLAAGREYDAAGQGMNGASNAPDHDNDFNVEQITSFYKVLQESGYHTMVTGRDDLTKRTGPGIDGSYHQHELGFSDQERCAGSVDVTWGECGGDDGGAAPCRGPV